MTRLAVEYLREVNKPQGGRVLVISSFVGYANFPGCAIYNASKAGKRKGWMVKIYKIKLTSQCGEALESAIATFQPELDPTWGIKVALNFLKSVNNAHILWAKRWFSSTQVTLGPIPW